jgi:hypothetical protein
MKIAIKNIPISNPDSIYPVKGSGTGLYKYFYSAFFAYTFKNKTIAKSSLNPIYK